MRPAIALIWLSLLWTLLCFVFYRDRELILQASLPVWIAAAVVWVAYRAVARLTGRRRRSAAARPRKRAAAKPAPGARRAARRSAAKPRKPSS
ncbi:MAG: hypothetical protein OXE53_04975 [Deltaproteobacteria bacterium]|nr:hypothetical protein [Deltaproteobacteria bacterium]